MANYTEAQWNAKKIEMMEKCFEGFSKMGLHGTGIRALARYCGCGSAKIYTYFEDLDDLIIQSTEYCMSKVEDDFMAKAPTDVADLWRFMDEIPYWTAEKHGKKYRRLLSILLALCLVAGLLPTVALAGETPSYSIDANGTLVISGTTDGSDLPTGGFTSIEITTTGVVTGGTYTVDVDNYGTITGGEFGSVMNRNGGTGSSLALITGGTFKEVSNYGNMTGGTVKDLTNFDTTNYGHTVQGVTVTGSLYNSNSNCNDMTLLIGLTSVTNNLSITTVKQLVNGTEILCPVGQNADSWLKSNVANADWYQLNGEEWVKLTDTDVFPLARWARSRISSAATGSCLLPTAKILM